MTEVLDEVDRRVGNVIEAASRRHHERRLRAIGWGRATRGSATGWASGTFPIRDGNRVEVFIDGVSALPAIAAAVRSATSFVHVAGWTITPGFALERSTEVITLRELLAEAAERVDVRVLVWAGAPFHLFHPSRGESRSSIDKLTAGTRIRGALDSRNRPMHCHHEKLVIVDGTLAFVGGIDLTDLGGDRFDGPSHDHAAGLGWHDAAASIVGPAVADVASHFAMRWEETAGERLDAVAVPLPAGESRVQVVRTVPERTYGALRNGEFSILEA
jgi:phosphatidylserine/phosphatidylglycerophosphate/cardiolipin synthase-like enzyme